MVSGTGSLRGAALCEDIGSLWGVALCKDIACPVQGIFMSDCSWDWGQGAELPGWSP